ncbi:MAG: hypothetical protein QOF76_2514 [Solirubrobacteraceae bacterium]|nr:hypothetical protein [Solirubrobacteraceae bacterium]
MIWFWPTVLRPVLEAARPSTLVEVGAAGGHNTKNILDFAMEHGARVHVIDPVPGFDVDGFQAKYGDHFIFHRCKSHEILAEIEAPDVVLIDGDHNWFTVYHELRLLGERAGRDGRPFPITLMHDVSWPYARRDMYYNPDDVPEEHRQPHRQANIVFGQSELSDEQGINGGLHNALTEGGPRNGVLTAVEQYIEEVPEPFVLRIVHGFSGLGMLAPAATLEAHPAVKEQFDRVMGAEFLFEHSRRLERIAIAGRSQASEASRKLRRAEGSERALKERVNRLEATADRLRERVEATTAAIDRLRARA